MEGCSDQPNPSVLTSSNLERCNRDSYLTTKERLSCPSCTEPVVFLGQDPSVVPVYVIYREHNSFLDIAYWMLFPYNRGKQVCIGFFQKGCFICPEFLGGVLAEGIWVALEFLHPFFTALEIGRKL